MMTLLRRSSDKQDDGERVDWWIAIPTVGVFAVPLVLHFLGVAFR